jgi:hypothetical protein
LVHTFFDPVPGVLDNFGSDVNLIRNFAVISAHNDGDGKSNGAVFVFDIKTGLHVQTIETPLSTSFFFGLRVQRVGQHWLAISEPTRAVYLRDLTANSSDIAPKGTLFLGSSVYLIAASSFAVA